MTTNPNTIIEKIQEKCRVVLIGEDIARKTEGYNWLDRPLNSRENTIYGFEWKGIEEIIALVQSTERAQTAQDFFNACIDVEGGKHEIGDIDYYELKLKYLGELKEDNE